MMSRPMAVGTGMATLLHILLVVVMATLYVNVEPMTSPPMEVEFLGTALTSPEEAPDHEAADHSRVPTIPERRMAGPLDQPGNDVSPVSIPELPESESLDLEALKPQLFDSSRPSIPLSPADRLAPVPIPEEGRVEPKSDVQVKVEGLLSTRKLVHLIQPVFPPDMSAGGEVKIRLLVVPDGTVQMAIVIQKAHHSLEDAALRAIRQWRFAAVRDSSLSEGVVTIRFELR